jgi:DNA-binding transcriptional regulator YdaS (Cro superfamily)
MNSISKAVELLGGITSAAVALNVSHQSVRCWIAGTRGFPDGLAPTVERLTGGAVRCEELSPSVDWAVLRNTEKAAA